MGVQGITLSIRGLGILGVQKRTLILTTYRMITKEKLPSPNDWVAVKELRLGFRVQGLS